MDVVPRAFTAVPTPVYSNFIAVPTPGPNKLYSDFTMQNLIPPEGRSEILETDHMCKETQRTRNVTKYSPRLQTSPASKILLRHQENGHATLRYIDDPGFPPRRPSPGTVWVYGTSDSEPDDTLTKIYGVWDKDGTGGDGRGVLLAEAPFDDGKCYQGNYGEESKRRQALPQRAHVGDEGNDLWCGTEVSLPSNLASDTIYTLYWVWSFPILLNETHPAWKQQIYTTCIDIEVV